MRRPGLKQEEETVKMIGIPSVNSLAILYDLRLMHFRETLGKIPNKNAKNMYDFARFCEKFQKKS